MSYPYADDRKSKFRGSRYIALPAPNRRKKINQKKKTDISGRGKQCASHRKENEKEWREKKFQSFLRKGKKETSTPNRGNSERYIFLIHRRRDLSIPFEGRLGRRSSALRCGGEGMLSPAEKGEGMMLFSFGLM